MKRTLRQVNRERKKLGYSNFSTLVNTFHLIRLALIIKLKEMTILRDISRHRKGSKT